MANSTATAAALDTEFTRGLGLYDSTMVVVGSMIGSGIFIVSADMARNLGGAGWLLAAWLLTGGADHCRRLVVRRARRDDAAGGRPVRLPPRSVFAALGLPLRLDAVSRDSDRHDCRRRGRLRALLRRARAVDRRGSLSDPAAPSLDRLRPVALDDAAGRHPDDRAAHMDEHQGTGVRPHRAERLHDRQDRRARRPHRRRAACSAGITRRSPTTSATCGRGAAWSTSCRG